MTLTTTSCGTKVKDTVSEDRDRRGQAVVRHSIATRDRLRSRTCICSVNDRIARRRSRSTEAVRGHVHQPRHPGDADLLLPLDRDVQAVLLHDRGLQEADGAQAADPPTGDIAHRCATSSTARNRIMGLGQIDLEVMLVSAFDIPHNRWKPDGWSWAREDREGDQGEDRREHAALTTSRRRRSRRPRRNGQGVQAREPRRSSRTGSGRR